jgi:hypothetical protein
MAAPIDVANAQLGLHYFPLRNRYSPTATATNMPTAAIATGDTMKYVSWMKNSIAAQAGLRTGVSTVPFNRPGRWITFLSR